MAKRVDRTFSTICELLETINGFGEILRAPDELAGPSKTPDKPETYRFIINTPQDRANALIKLVFGEEIYEKKLGNPSFLKHDMELMRELKIEKAETEKTKDKLLEKYIPRAQRRKHDTDDESVRSRLEDAYALVNKEEKQSEQRSEAPDNIDFDAPMTDDFNLTEDDLRWLLPWLKKYRVELINLLSQ